MSYASSYKESIEQPEAFWAEQAKSLKWFKDPETVLRYRADGLERWFADGELNTSYLALDLHVESGRGDQAAVIYDSPVTQTQASISYKDLLHKVEVLAGALKRDGLEKGDRVIIYMPMIPEAVIAMLACARLGAIHSVVFGGFAANELAARIDDAKPKFILAATCGIEPKRVVDYVDILNKASAIARHKVAHRVFYEREQLQLSEKHEGDFLWHEFIEGAEPAAPVPLKGDDPLYILYTSGSTGKPKGIVRDNGGHAVALRYSMQAVYNAHPGDVYWAASDVGWVVGHSYIVYAPLLTGCSTILFEGKPVGTPDAGVFGRIIAEHKVNVLFTAPTAFRAIRKEDPEGKAMLSHQLSSLRTLFLAGERCDPPTLEWLKDLFKVPVVDNWWQTETGWPIVANPIGLEHFPSKSGSATYPTPGYNVQVLDDAGDELAAKQQGSVVIKRPLPPGCLLTIWGDDEAYFEKYLETYEGYYLSGDGGYIDDEGYVFIMGRVDDVINIAGHRLSTGEMEEVVASHPGVAECAVVGIDDNLKGQLPIALVVLKNGIKAGEQALFKELKLMLRDKIGPIAVLKSVNLVSQLPKTRSGKILRYVIRSLADQKPYKEPATILDPSAIDELKSTFASLHDIAGNA